MLNKIPALAGLSLLTLVVPIKAIAQAQPPTAPPGYYWPGPWHMWSGGYGWSYFWMFPMMIFFMFVVCMAIFFFARRMSGDRPDHWRPWGDPTEPALHILNERFARGEIQEDEYRHKKAIILSAGED